MDVRLIFAVQVLLSFLVYGLAARWYVRPRLAALPFREALQPLLLLHAFRHPDLRGARAGHHARDDARF